MAEKVNEDRTIYQRAVDVAANGETVIDVVCAAVDEALKAVETRCQQRIDVLLALGDDASKNYAAAYSTLQQWCETQREDQSSSVPAAQESK